jgi:hypothetical protein
MQQRYSVAEKAISAVSVVQTSTPKTANEFEFGSLQKEFNLIETSGVRTPNTVPYVPYSQHQQSVKEYFL